MKKLFLSLIVFFTFIGLGFSQTFQSIIAFDTNAELNAYNYSWLDDSPGLAFCWEDSTLYSWSSNVSAWEKYNPNADSTMYVQGNGTPVGSTTPNYINEAYLDTTNINWYLSTGLTNNDWDRISNESDTPYIEGDGDPRGVTTPNYIGEEYLDTTNNVWYKADSLANTDWEKDVIISSGEEFFLANYHFDSDETVNAAQDSFVLKYIDATGKIQLEPDAGAGSGSNLDTLLFTDSLTISNDGGTNAVLPAATTTIAGVMTATDKTKLDGIDSGAADDQVLSAGYGIDLSGSPDYTVEVDTNEILTIYDSTLLADQMFFNGNQTATKDLSHNFGGYDLNMINTDTFYIAGDEYVTSFDSMSLNVMSDIILNGQVNLINPPILNSDTILVTSNDSIGYRLRDNIVLTQEEVEDYAGNLVENGTGTHTGITVTYQDATGDIDFVVDHDAATNFDATEHAPLDDTATGTDTVWSADKIISYVGTEKGEVNTHSTVPTASGDTIIYDKNGVDLRFKGIEEADGTIIITSDADDVLIGVDTINASRVRDFDTEVSNNTDVSDNTTHKSSTGADHTYINQSVINGSSPTFDGSNFTNMDANDVNIADGGNIITATDVEGALQENRTAIDANTNKTITLTGDVTGSGTTNISTTIGSDQVNDTHIDWGTGGNQVSASDVPIADAGGVITGTNVETALQENRDSIDINSAKISYPVTTATATELDWMEDLYDTGVTDVEFDVLDDLTSTTTELNGLDGLTASRSVVTNGSGILTTDASPTLAELDYLSGTDSNIENHFDAVETSIDSKLDTLITIEERASGKTLTYDDNLEVQYFTANSSFTLPSAKAGLKYIFVSDGSIGFSIRAATGDHIRVAGNNVDGDGVSPYCKTSTEDAYITLVSVDDEFWFATSHYGTFAASGTP